MILIFRNRRNEEREIGRPESLKESMKIIQAFLKDHHFTSYYTRLWVENNRLVYDVGSHTEFFYLDQLNEEAIENLKSRKLL